MPVSTTPRPRGSASLDMGHPLNAGIVAAYPLVEGAGSRFYDAAGRFPLSLGGSVANSTWPDGPDGVAWSPLSNNYAQCVAVPADKLALLNSPSFSVAAWVWVPSATPSSYQAVLLFGRADATAVRFGVWKSSSSPMHFRWSSGASQDFATAVVAKRWTFVTAVYDALAGQASMYVDGRKDSTVASTITSTIASPGALYLGSLFGASQYFAGRVSNCRLWGRAIQAAEVAQLAADPWAGYRTQVARVAVPPRPPAPVSMAYAGLGVALGATGLGEDGLGTYGLN